MLRFDETEVVLKCQSEMKQRKIGYYDQFIYVNKAIVYHSLEKPDAGIRNLVKLYVKDSFKNADIAFRLKIVILELIMQFDSGDIDSFNSRLKITYKEFRKVLGLPEFLGERTLLALMEKMIGNIEWVKDKKLVSRVKKFIKESKKTSKTDTSLLSYEEWMEKKLKILRQY